MSGHLQFLLICDHQFSFRFQRFGQRSLLKISEYISRFMRTKSTAPLRFFLTDTELLFFFNLNNFGVVNDNLY